MATFKSVVTKLGQARIAAAIQSGKDINITDMAVGDGGGKPTQPDAAQTKLIKETYRTKLNSLKLDAKNQNWIIAEAIISASVGGFWMREMGLYADDGALIAVCNMADTYKPTLAEGSGRTQTLRMVITVTDTSAVSLTIDDTLIIATEEYVNDLLSGTLMPEITGGKMSLLSLRLMAEQGRAWSLIDGGGTIYGMFVIESVNETHTEFFADGSARSIDFTISLLRVDESLSAMFGDLRTQADGLVDKANGLTDYAKGMAGGIF